MGLSFLRWRRRRQRLDVSYEVVVVVGIAIRGWSGGERRFFLRGCSEAGVLVFIVVADVDDGHQQPIAAVS